MNFLFDLKKAPPEFRIMQLDGFYKVQIRHWQQDWTDFTRPTDLEHAKEMVEVGKQMYAPNLPEKPWTVYEENE